MSSDPEDFEPQLDGPSAENGAEDSSEEDIDEDEDEESSDEEPSDSEDEMNPEDARAAEEAESSTIEARSEVPQSIMFKMIVVGISCHPKRNLLASGAIDGQVFLHSYSTEAPNMEITCFDHHKKPCRVVHFSDSGEHLFTGSQDTTICVLDLEKNSIFRKFSRVDGAPLYSMLPIDNYLLASGEDNGAVVLWDFRIQTPIALFEECYDYISSLTMSRDKKTLLATSGDGTLSAYNIRGKKMEMRSEEFDNDLLSAGIFKEGTKVAVGSGDGSLNIFNWGEFGNISDRFPGHPGSVDSMAVLGEDVVLTGCDDGKVRAVQLFPNRHLGVLGSHAGFPVEGLSLAFDRKFLASCSYDQAVRFWDLSGIEAAKAEDPKESKKSKHRSLNGQVDDFFSDL